MRRLLAALSFMALASCGGDSATATSASAAGTYNLSNVNGSALPFTVQDSPKVEMLSDVFVLNTDGTLTQRTSVRITDGTSVTTQDISDTGTYQAGNASISFHFNSDGSSYTAARSGGTFVITDGTFSFAYVKQ